MRPITLPGRDRLIRAGASLVEGRTHHLPIDRARIFSAVGLYILKMPAGGCIVGGEGGKSSRKTRSEWFQEVRLTEPVLVVNRLYQDSGPGPEESAGLPLGSS